MLRRLVSSKPASILVCLVAVTAIRFVSRAQDAAPPAPTDVFIQNAFIMTATHGNIPSGSIYIKDGKIAAVGAKITTTHAALFETHNAVTILEDWIAAVSAKRPEDEVQVDRRMSDSKIGVLGSA